MDPVCQFRLVVVQQYGNVFFVQFGSLSIKYVQYSDKLANFLV